MNKQKLLLTSLFILFFLSTEAQSDWNLGKDKDGIQVYTRKVDGFKLKEVKAETQINANIHSIVSVIADFNNHFKWVDNCAISEIVETPSEDECYFYNTYTTPWPAKDRDAITHVLFEERKEDFVKINFEGIPGYLEEKDGYVRVPFSKGGWLLKKIDEQNTHVVYQMHVDSGGSIPKWMVNELLLKSPFKTVRNLKTKTEEK